MRFDCVDGLEPFPPFTSANEDGLLAVGGDLTPERLVCAYSQGIFPWFAPGDPILWWSPDPRCVLFPGKMHISRSLTKALRQCRYRITMNQAFVGVIDACAGPRKGVDDTWITSEMRSAYLTLHRMGLAHSIEVFDLEQRLIGGLYGVLMGRVFFGESMFSHVSNASKMALHALCGDEFGLKLKLIDCQMTSDHLLSLGAEEISRHDFMGALSRWVNA